MNDELERKWKGAVMAYYNPSKIEFLPNNI
jgi:hypothetical protein